MSYSRRQILVTAASTALISSLSTLSNRLHAAARSSSPIATNTYPWRTFARRRGQEFVKHSDALLADIVATGITGYEPIIDDLSEFDGLGERLQKHGLTMESIYVNSTLHEESKIDASIDAVVGIAETARELGTQIVVTNPAPIRWGGTEDKSDRQLVRQAEALDRLGTAIRDFGMVLAYHNHDAELRQGGREFHHMLTATDPRNVKLCLDAHWIFRGCGDSQVALFDAVRHYHDRIVELHLRQSTQGVWREDFRMQDDIDYKRLFSFLASRRITPKLVLEQAVEEGSPDRSTVVEAHRISRQNLEASV